MKRERYNAKGFTIIELIVVIAIIAVLAAIVITSVTVYIGRAKDTATKADLSQIAKKLQVYYTDTSDYSEFEGPTVAFPCLQDYTINKDANNFAVFAQLCTNSDYWCVDSTGKNVQLAAHPDAGVNNCREGSGSINPPNSSCQGTCSGCEGLGSDDYCSPPDCCSSYSACTWNPALNEGFGSCDVIVLDCPGGDPNSCGVSCPSGWSCQ